MKFWSTMVDFRNQRPEENTSNSDESLRKVNVKPYLQKAVSTSRPKKAFYDRANCKTGKVLDPEL